MPTCITGNSSTAQYSAMRKLLDLVQQVISHFDALLACALRRSKSFRSGEADTFVGEHRLHHGFDALEVAFAAGERTRIDCEERLPDARLVALLGEKRIRFRPDRRAGQRRTDEFECEREHRAFRAADRKEAPALNR